MHKLKSKMIELHNNNAKIVEKAEHETDHIENKIKDFRYAYAKDVEKTRDVIYEMAKVKQNGFLEIEGHLNTTLNG